MRNVVLYALTSLDGVCEAPEDFVIDFDASMARDLEVVTSQQDAVVMGRRTYDIWSRYWPTIDDDPFADFINAVPKYVITSTRLPGRWANARPVHGDPAGFLNALRTRDGGDIGIHGSITLANTLLSQRIVDEAHLVIVPQLAGRGRALQPSGLINLDLRTIKATPSGAIVAHYVLPGPRMGSPTV